MKNMDSVCSDRLRLRRFRRNDARVIAAYRSDPEVARFQGWSSPFSVGAARRLIAEVAEADETQPGWLQWAVERTRDGAVVGDVGVNLLADCMQASVGYTLAPEFQGRGYAFEIMQRVVDHLFAERGLHRVSAECDVRNVASAALLERLGFRREALLRAATWSKGEWCDDYVYAALSDEWAQRRGAGGDRTNVHELPRVRRAEAA